MSALKKLDPSVKMENTAANSRAAFQILAEYIASTLGEENVLADYHELCLHVTANAKKSVIAIRSGSCRLAVKSAAGEWLYLPGIDYVLYLKGIGRIVDTDNRTDEVAVVIFTDIVIEILPLILSPCILALILWDHIAKTSVFLKDIVNLIIMDRFNHLLALELS